MDGLIKKSLTKILLLLTLGISIQNIQAMYNNGVFGDGQPQPNPFPAQQQILINAPQQAPVAQVQQNPHVMLGAHRAAQSRSRIRRILGCLGSFTKETICSLAYPFKKLPSLGKNLYQTSKGLFFTTLDCAEIIAYLYAMDNLIYYSTPVASDFANFIHLSQWAPTVVKDFFTRSLTYYKPGDFASLINSIGHKMFELYSIWKAGGGIIPSTLLCPAPEACPAQIVCQTCPTPTCPTPICPTPNITLSCPTPVCPTPPTCIGIKW